VLVNNAFLIPPDLTSGKPFCEVPLSNWDDMIDVGTRSAYVASVFAARRMVRGRRLIANISSSGAKQYAWHVAYGVGKAALDRLTADTAHELRDRGVAVVSLWPGLVRHGARREVRAQLPAFQKVKSESRASRAAPWPHSAGDPDALRFTRPRDRSARARRRLRLHRRRRLAARRPARAPADVIGRD
jgi:NAD(P)-dependent dehydrogenase (short-subunit alcohol dehydrogenase family)